MYLTNINFVSLRHSNEDSRSSAHDSPAVHVGEVDEPRRKLLREVELKVMRYADKLEANGMSKSSTSFQYQLEKYRQGLIEVSIVNILRSAQSRWSFYSTTNQSQRSHWASRG